MLNVLSLSHTHTNTLTRYWLSVLPCYQHYKSRILLYPSPCVTILDCLEITGIIKNIADVCNQTELSTKSGISGTLCTAAEHQSAINGLKCAAIFSTTYLISSASQLVNLHLIYHALKRLADAQQPLDVTEDDSILSQ